MDARDGLRDAVRGLGSQRVERLAISVGGASERLRDAADVQVGCRAGVGMAERGENFGGAIWRLAMDRHARRVEAYRRAWG